MTSHEFGSLFFLCLCFGKTTLPFNSKTAFIPSTYWSLLFVAPKSPASHHLRLWEPKKRSSQKNTIPSAAQQ